ncbi:MAG: DUF1269 domain-containing protein [Anaerolineae bacterium]|nr:DUF1269 domain-containing protein [Anaerolineae bacterium]NIN96063.1 DUF1269 domain-containing protein [Anaerolineae bacterium]NIQ79093.1 DUF1269 domain-containing protein [Anaerolineae bacterium]
MESPVELIVAAFREEDKAAKVLAGLKEFDKEKVIGVWDAAVLVKDQDGKVSIREMAEERGIKRGAGIGAIAGGILGIVVGGPICGIVLGAGAGALTGKVVDLGFSDKEFKDIAELVGPGSSAIIAVIEHKWVGQLVDALDKEGAEIIRQELKDELAYTIATGMGEEEAVKA